VTTAASESLFPGGVGISALHVYQWPTSDGLAGGTPHMHLACSEGYVVEAGHGSVQTLTSAGYTETELRPGDVVWFTPGTVHRLISGDGELRINVTMQNAGLPEAGDAVLTLPPELLASRSQYEEATSVVDPLSGRPDPARTRRRRDLAIEGFLALRADLEEGNGTAFVVFRQSAAALVADLIPQWRDRWQRTALAAALRTGGQLDALERGDGSHLAHATVHRAERPPQDRLGMCGFLAPYPLDDAPAK
jgi:mannose-6-phosphate isomerase-like protein (cupin superfamily)